MKVLAPNANTTLGDARQVLCVFQPTRIYPSYEKVVLGRAIISSDSAGLSRVQKLLSWPVRIAFYRANPRNTTYMLDVAIPFLQEKIPGVQIDLLVEPAGWASVPADYQQRVRRVWQSRNPYFRPLERELIENLKQQRYDLLALLYADSIGLSWFPVERALKHLNVTNTIVINGRRRVFVWDAEARRRLYLRRALEKSWAFESAFSLGFVVFTPLLLLYEVLPRVLCSRRDAMEGT